MIPITWIYRAALFALLFGMSASTYGGNHDSAIMSGLINISPLISLAVMVLCYFSLPSLYKAVAWVLVISVILLVLESKYEYGQFVYSYFVIKRFAYCGVALTAYYVASKAGPLKIEYANYIIFGFFIFNQLLLGQIFAYALTSETRTTLSPDALYLVIPFLYYLVLFLRDHRLIHLLVSLFTLVVIILLLHRTVISAGVIAAGVVVGLAVIGKVTTNHLPVWRTLITFVLILGITAPFTGMLPESKVNAFVENIGGIFSPKQDNTASWRMEQAEYYLSQIPERPLFGWRYDGYDKGEIMENEDFPEKGTIIHSQYIDMIFNYGYFGLLINVVLMLGALVALFRSRRKLSTDQLVLFGFIISGVVFGVSYQLPVYLWAFMGVGMYYGLHPPTDYFTEVPPSKDEDVTEYSSVQTMVLKH